MLYIALLDTFCIGVPAPCLCRRRVPFPEKTLKTPGLWATSKYMWNLSFLRCSASARLIGASFWIWVAGKTTTIWPSFSSLDLAVWAAWSVLTEKKNNKKILTITIGFQHYVLEPLIQVAHVTCFQQKQPHSNKLLQLAFYELQLYGNTRVWRLNYPFVFQKRKLGWVNIDCSCKFCFSSHVQWQCILGKKTHSPAMYDSFF